MPLRFPRRWLRFSLRSLLLVVTGLSIWLGLHLDAVRRQSAAIAEVKRLGGRACYDYQYAGDGELTEGESPSPVWLFGWLGPDFFHDVVFVDMSRNADGQENTQTTDEIKAVLPDFRELRTLYLTQGQATDDCLRAVGRLSKLEQLFCWNAIEATDAAIAPLANLPRLKSLHFSNSWITDESLLVFGQMPALETLSIQQNSFTDGGLAHLRHLKRLKKLYADLGETRFTDVGLVHLHALPSLEAIGLARCDVTENGVTALKEALPNLRQIDDR